MKKIRIRYLSDKIEKLTYIDGKSDWIDLRAAADLHFEAGEYKLIPLGVAMQLPAGYEAHIAPRSSSFSKGGFLQVNSVGVVDNSYSGTNDIWKLPVYATRDAVIEVNDRICQFRIMERMPQVTFREVAALYATDRGGFGSPGSK